ncbi:unnamed protein product, partial [Schistosoma turkestanicum]
MLLLTKTVKIFIIFNYYYTNYLISCANESFLTIDDGILRNFCEANEICAKQSTSDKQYFLMGLNCIQWIPDKNYSSKIFWTSIVHLLPEVNTTSMVQLILRDANPMGRMSSIADNPSTLNPSRVLLIPSKQLRPDSLSAKKNYGIVCELFRKGIQTMSRFTFQQFSKFFQFNYLHKTPKLDSCHIQLRVSNLNECLY